MKKDIGNVVTNKENRIRVFWDNETHAVEFKQKLDGPTYSAPYASNENDAKRNAKEEADNHNL
jgi:hypothetical protein